MTANTQTSTQTPATESKAAAPKPAEKPAEKNVTVILPALPDDVAEKTYKFTRHDDFYHKHALKEFDPAKHMGKFSCIVLQDDRVLYVYLVGLVHDFKRDVNAPYAYVLNEATGKLLPTALLLKVANIKAIFTRKNVTDRKPDAAKALDASSILGDISE